ncbi:TPA: hypothetical protein NKU90_000386 [Vibrio parahaemolyticus]|uniref:hypothetical protein n=1 Tax=Vibrio parahaemolyticus TaxID=670 RepID=UPI0005F112B2|nr:hypothetical protein [Vibrio parahaemolyticus]EGR1562227.1 hypothetical protein [Vibrio alginolyticus]EJS2607775.1 hypothetical protein [Vibrio alginolyticus]KWU38712.1 hypothetical protein AVL52_02810 [Vibrio parahaemolyticus]MCZ6285994.1 hypothetical protein [Vibrio parahaemolyticus]TOM90393.1 hypothetical protein CGH68_09675 [Vibrio parahaemolyticus]
MDSTWVSAIVATIALFIAIINVVFGRTDKGQSTARDHDRRIHANELATERLRGDVAEKYATKHELREAVDDIKASMDSRFDRLEAKLDKKEREAA